MTTAGQNRMYHTSYPLQAPLEASRRSSVSTNGSGESHSRYRYSIVSQQGGLPNGCPFQNSMQFRQDEPMAQTGSLLNGLPSSETSSMNGRTWSYGTEDEVKYTQPSSQKWVRNSYPINSTHEDFSKFDTVTADSVQELAHERSPSQLSHASSTATAGRTLRRTPRSRRIESPIQVNHDNEPSTLVSHHIERGSATLRAQKNQWNRTTDSVDSIPHGVPGTFPESPEQERQQNPLAMPQSEFVLSDHQNQETLTHGQSSSHPPSHNSLAAFAAAAVSNHGSADSSNQETQHVKQNASTNDTWHRRAYPLQTPASNTTLRSPLTPPPSPPEETRSVNADEIQERHDEERQQNVPNRKPLRRQAYPLQSPASAVNLQHESATPLSEDEGASTPTTPVAPQVWNNDKTPPATKSMRRQAYPLQSPASILDLQYHPSEPLLEKTGSAVQTQSHNDPTKAEHPFKAVKAMRRQAYPLQSPASTLNLHQPYPQDANEDNVSSQDALAPTTEQPQPQSTSKKSLRRQAYPLQAPASTTDLQHAQPATPADPPLGSGEKPNTDHPVKLASEQPRPSKSLRRQAYPLQAPASLADLLQDHKERPAKQASDEDSHSRAVRDQKQDQQSSAVDKPLRRKGYPLQGPASTLELPQTQTPDEPREPEVQARQELPKILTEEADSPGASSPWRRQPYPLQALGDIAPSRAVTPRPSAEQLPVHRDPNSILLPKNIPAVKDAESVSQRGRTIVVCLDGTGDKFDADNSNIVHLVSALKKDDARQVTYYQAGIGTYSRNGLSSGFAAAMDMAVGSGLGEHVRDAYHFLMHTYKEGDKICIFGFSRGAYTARCLAGMVHKVGLLPPRNIQQIPFAYEFYANDTPEGWKLSGDFKKTFSIDVNVYFLGCFDSVASVGFIPRQLPLSSTPNNKPIYFRHAMALDERRAKFKICRHQKKNWEEIEEKKSPTSAIIDAVQSKLPTQKDQNDTPKVYSPSAYGAKNHPNLTDEEYQRLMGPHDNFETDVLEVWFAGAHADIGGGAVANVERHKLAQIPLRWMIRQAFECNTGILFKTRVLAEHGLDVHTLWPKYERLKTPSHGPPPSYLERYEKGLPPRSIRQSKLVPTNQVDNGEQLLHLKSHTDEDWTPEQVEDFYDAITPLNDQLIQAPTWWILELWPVELKIPVAPGKYYVRTGMNLGRYRAAEDHEPNLHWTVLQRMQQLGYKIEVRTPKQTKWKTVV